MSLIGFPFIYVTTSFISSSLSCRSISATTRTTMFRLWLFCSWDRSIGIYHLSSKLPSPSTKVSRKDLRSIALRFWFWPFSPHNARAGLDPIPLWRREPEKNFLRPLDFTWKLDKDHECLLKHGGEMNAAELLPRPAPRIPTGSPRRFSEKGTKILPFHLVDAWPRGWRFRSLEARYLGPNALALCTCLHFEVSTRWI